MRHEDPYVENVLRGMQFTEFGEKEAYVKAIDISGDVKKKLKSLGEHFFAATWRPKGEMRNGKSRQIKDVIFFVFIFSKCPRCKKRL